ncbi:outer membrane protein assembly factor BamA [Paucihalobacter ruber]|uniref:Outer membrane protein assembly factor BamA n=1 Tax=Paucihalobacter ruber TaxID=2567861 RepID=A0A506PUB7_9FLAO|nr:outer membrane protein assembly factor BamA [Paucihalobacter ruber]TPV35820.1 outer membrane protein assembly factor BamA [Paucihalobacter ruber]
MKTHQKTLILFSFLLCSLLGNAQEYQFDTGKSYIIGDIAISGSTSYAEQTIIVYSGLRKEELIKIPGEKLSNAIKKLWKSNLFSSIDIYATKFVQDTVYLEIEINDLPELNNVTIKGVKKGKFEEIKTENKLQKGTKVTENLITTTKNYLTNKYKKKGYLNADVNIITTEVLDSIEKKRVNMLIDIDQKDKVKIKSITFVGNEVFKDKRLRKVMKKTKVRNPVRFWKRSKYIVEDYKEDLTSLIDFYKENGYRDARVVSDTLIKNDDNTIALKLNINEGSLYTFGKITFVGNTVYSDAQLRSVLRIEEGSTYNGVELAKRIEDNTKPDGDNLVNRYQDSGYLFSSINPVETSADGNVIDMEIRITEGKPAYLNKVTVVGNDITNDRVIYRELRTRPGQLYSKSNIVRTIRELGQLGFFDAQQIAPNIKNPDPNAGTLDIEYSVVEQGSSQIELQGGYGGGGFIGTLGLSFNNFAIKDILKKDAYKPVPRGDGQTLALRLQASQFFQTYSLNFMEPWLGGKRPQQFSVSLSQTKQFLFDQQTFRADRSRSFNISGISVGLARRLSIPDDYFTLSQSIGLQHYNLNNYNTGLFTFGDGYANNLSYTVALARNNTYTDPIFPTGGSNFIVSAKLSLPYSLFNNVDYKALSEERESLNPNDPSDFARIGEIDQERFSWLEFYKIKLRGDNYTTLFKKFVLRSNVEFGFLGAYNNDRGIIPFERFFLGGDGLGNFALDGREVVQLRGYPNQSLSSVDGGAIYNKFSIELRHPITLGAGAKIFALGFLEAGASFNSFREYNPFNMNRSAGFGVRIFMPAFGLLGIDFGHGFDPLPGQTVKNGWETHFIIGQQF